MSMPYRRNYQTFNSGFRSYRGFSVNGRVRVGTRYVYSNTPRAGFRKSKFGNYYFKTRRY